MLGMAQFQKDWEYGKRQPRGVPRRDNSPVSDDARDMGSTGCTDASAAVRQGARGAGGLRHNAPPATAAWGAGTGGHATRPTSLGQPLHVYKASTMLVVCYTVIELGSDEILRMPVDSASAATVVCQKLEQVCWECPGLFGEVARLMKMQPPVDTARLPWDWFRVAPRLAYGLRQSGWGVRKSRGSLVSTVAGTDAPSESGDS